MRKVTVTGAGGFIGSAICNAFLKKGVFSINCSGRTTAGMLGLFQLPRGPELITTYVHDLARPDTLQAVIRDSEIIVHCSSPGDSSLFRRASTTDISREVVMHAVNGVRAVIDAALQSPASRRIILISSLAAMMEFDVAEGAEQVYHPNAWSSAGKAFVENPEDPAFWAFARAHPYAASKAATEAVFWASAPSFSAGDRDVRLLSICPGLCLGRVHNAHRAGSVSVALIQDLVRGKASPLNVALSRVEDVATAVVRGAMLPNVHGRYIVASAITHRPTPEFTEVIRRHARRYEGLTEFLPDRLPDNMSYSIGSGRCDLSRTREELDLDPDVTVEEALLPQLESMLQHGLLSPDALMRAAERDRAYSTMDDHENDVAPAV